MALATIQKIKEVNHHYNADALDIVKVLGWDVVTRRDEFKVNDLVVYVSLDSILPNNNPAFAFLENKNFRIKTQKLRGHVSYGICFPLSVVSDIDPNLAFKEGMDVTEVIGVEKFEKPIPNSGEAKGGFPTNIIQKTDEERLQNIPWVIDELRGKEIYITVKSDGSSMTAFNFIEGCSNYELVDEKYKGFNLCSRNMLLKSPVDRDDPQSTFWKVAIDKNLEEVLDHGVAFQGEVVGGKIQGNPHKLNGYNFHVFNIMDIAPNKKASRWNYDDMKDHCKAYGLDMVNEVFRGKFEDLECETIEDFIKLADSARYTTPDGKKVQAEGIVVRLVESEIHPKMQKELSFKVISPKYALKHGE